MPVQNRLARSVAPLQSLPLFLRARAQTILFRRTVPFTGTARIVFDEVTPERVTLHLDGPAGGSKDHEGDECAGDVRHARSRDAVEADVRRSAQCYDGLHLPGF